MNLTISDAKLKKEVLKALQAYEVNELGGRLEDAGPAIVLDRFPLEDLRKCVSPEATLTVFSASPDLNEGGRIRDLVDNGIVRPYQLVYIGLRKASKEEMGFLAEKNVRNYPMREIAFTSHQEVCDAAMQVSRQRKELVLLVDLSVLDPAFLPGTLPGGMTSRELIYFLQRFRLLKNLKAAIITGFDEAPVELLAKLVVELS